LLLGFNPPLLLPWRMLLVLYPSVYYLMLGFTAPLLPWRMLLVLYPSV
jgi:hypothetical protein